MYYSHRYKISWLAISSFLSPSHSSSASSLVRLHTQTCLEGEEWRGKEGKIKRARNWEKSEKREVKGDEDLFLLVQELEEILKIAHKMPNLTLGSRGSTNHLNTIGFIAPLVSGVYRLTVNLYAFLLCQVTKKWVTPRFNSASWKAPLDFG